MIRTHLLTLIAAVALGGCEDVQTERAPSLEQARTEPAPEAKPSAEPVGRYGSALSGAKRAAQNTADEIGERQKELAEQINKQLEGGS